VEDLQWLVLVERQVGSVEAVKLRYPPASCFVSRESFEAVIPSIHSGLGPLSAIYQKQPDLLMLFLERRARNLIGCHEGL
jgi:hypothetical protein